MTDFPTGEELTIRARELEPVLHGGVRHSGTISTLAKALVAAQADLAPVSKDSLNPHFRSRYASLDSVIEAVRVPLARHGLAIVQGSTSTGNGVLTVETVLLHQSGEWLANYAIVPMVKIDPQGAGGALTYGRRYGLSALLSLATEEDDDANGASRRTPAKPAAAPKPPQAEKASSEQVGEIQAKLAVLVQSGMDPDTIAEVMKNSYGTAEPVELDGSQAEDLLKRLNARVAEAPPPVEA